MSCKVAVVGATGAVGREILKTLAERSFPAMKVVALASQRSVGKHVSYGDEVLAVQNLASYDFTGTTLALFSAGSKCSTEYAPKAAAAGALVIDNSSYFRLEPDVPLVVPEVNGHTLSRALKRRIVANPNCVAAPLVLALKPFLQQAGIKRVVVSTYQSASGKGRLAMDELFRQCKAVMVGDPLERNVFKKQIAFNLFPHIGDFMEDGNTEEEWKVQTEVRKILEKDIPVAVTCVRVPVFIGHSMAVAVECEKPLPLDQARAALKAMPGIIVWDNRAEEEYITPIEAAGDDAVYVSRLRIDPTVKHGFLMWVVSDNLRKGAALNAVQIAESLLSHLHAVDVAS